MQSVVTGLLARHELYVARFYLDRGKFDAAVARIQYALHTLSDSGLEPEAMVLLAEVYMKEHERRSAVVVLELMLSRYLSSLFIVLAQRFLGELAVLEKAGPRTN